MNEAVTIHLPGKQSGESIEHPGLALVRSPYFWLVGLLLLSAWMAIAFGAASKDLAYPWHWVTHWWEAETSGMMTIIHNIRVPRAILAILVGGALAISGASLQGICRNPLADPGLLGISAGAAAAAVTGIVFMNHFTVPDILRPYLLSILAFLGAAVTAVLIHRMAQVNGRIQIVTLLLAGIALNALFAALVGIMSYLADDQSLRLITYWLMGSLGAASWDQLLFVFPLLALAMWGIYRKRNELNLLLLGEANARFLGVEVEKVKHQLLWFNALAVGVAVSVSGIIGFVGLLIPHILRVTLGSDYRQLLPQVLLLGGSVMLVADLVSRLIMAPAEVPIGIITSLLGAPVFVVLLLRQRNRLSFGV